MDQPDPVAEQAEPAAAVTTRVNCGRCGITAPSPPITWMFELDRIRGGRWYCEDCARGNLRAVEAKLDHEWW